MKLEIYNGIVYLIQHDGNCEWIYNPNGKYKLQHWSYDNRSKESNIRCVTPPVFDWYSDPKYQGKPHKCKWCRKFSLDKTLFRLMLLKQLG